MMPLEIRSTGNRACPSYVRTISGGTPSFSHANA